MLPHWEIMPPAPWPNIALSHIIRHRANQFMPYPNHAESLARNRQVPYWSDSTKFRTRRFESPDRPNRVTTLHLCGNPVWSSKYTLKGHPFLNIYKIIKHFWIYNIVECTPSRRPLLNICILKVTLFWIKLSNRFWINTKLPPVAKHIRKYHPNQEAINSRI